MPDPPAGGRGRGAPPDVSLVTPARRGGGTGLRRTTSDGGQTEIPPRVSPPPPPPSVDDPPGRCGSSLMQTDLRSVLDAFRSDMMADVTRALSESLDGRSRADKRRSKVGPAGPTRGGTIPGVAVHPPRLLRRTNLRPGRPTVKMPGGLLRPTGPIRRPLLFRFSNVRTIGFRRCWTTGPTAYGIVGRATGRPKRERWAERPKA